MDLRMNKYIVRDKKMACILELEVGQGILPHQLVFGVLGSQISVVLHVIL